MDQTVLAGGAPAEEALVDEEKLWRREARVGVGIDMAGIGGDGLPISRLAERRPIDGALYAATHTRLAADVCRFRNRHSKRQAMAMEKAQSEGSGQEAAGHAWLYRHMQEWLIEGWRSTPYATSRGYSKRDDSGIANPLENGFAFHHSLGVPYLAATGLKGALRAYWEQWHSAEGKEQFTGRLFGKNGVAGVAFFDMLPTTPPTLGPEVMTPHYGDWYAASGADIAANAPGDWMSPIPIPFLAVETGATFQIAVAPRTAGDPDWPRHLQCMRDVLGDALSVVGLGAKTAVGYGRFKLSDGRRETAPSPGAPKPRPRAGQAGPPYQAGQTLRAGTRLSWHEIGNVVLVRQVTLRPGITLPVRFVDDDAEERKLGVCRRLAAAMPDHRDQRRVRHEMFELVMARASGIACGHKDGNDHDRLRHDPLMKLAVGRCPQSGAALASQATYSRLENAPRKVEAARLTGALVDQFGATVKPGKEEIIDIDDTFCAAHGGQQLAFWNAHQDERGFATMHINHVRSGTSVCAILRPARTPKGTEVRTVVEHVTRRLKRLWPRTRLIWRGDSHYGRDEVMEWCEDNGEAFIFGLPGNSVLDAMVAETCDHPRFWHAIGTCRGSAALTTDGGGRWPPHLKRWLSLSSPLRARRWSLEIESSLAGC